MIAAHRAEQRPADARLLVVDWRGFTRHLPRREFPSLLSPGDIVIANDAATLPASLSGTHERTGESIELRLAGRDSLSFERVSRFSAVLFGAGDYRTPTEHRPLPPRVEAGDILRLGPLRALVRQQLGHPRLVDVEFMAQPGEVWEALSRHGRPIQYAYVQDPLGVWDTWTRIAGRPVAFEAPSASFVLDWTTISAVRARGAAFAAITLAAGLSSTGDDELDARLPLDEAYEIPMSTARGIEAARDRGGRVIAIGTSVVRALEHAARADSTVRAGPGLATQRIGPSTCLRVVDAILSGTHERGTSHYELLRAFQADAVLDRLNAEADALGYRTHEFGDSIFVERQTPLPSGRLSWPPSAARDGRRPRSSPRGCTRRCRVRSQG